MQLSIIDELSQYLYLFSLRKRCSNNYELPKKVSKILDSLFFLIFFYEI